MGRSWISVSLIGASTTFVPTLALADVLWNTGPNDDAGAVQSQFVTASGYFQEAADDFVLGNPLANGAGFQITSIRGWMYVNNTTMTSGPVLSMTVFADDGTGLPGAALQVRPGSVVASAPSAAFPNFHIVEMEATGLPFSLGASQRYWVKWEGIGQGLYFFATGGNSVMQGFEAVYRNNFPGTTAPNWTPVSALDGFSQTDLAFTIEGYQMPAPSGAALMGGALIAGLARRRR